MTKPRNSKKQIEDQLAKYTDGILNGRESLQDKATFAPESELRALEETALGLKQAFGNDDPDEEVIHRMRNKIVKEWQVGKVTGNIPLWKKWFQSSGTGGREWQSQQSRQRLSIAISLVTLIALMLVSIPIMNTISSDQPGASGQNPNAFVLVVFGLLILLGLWFYRRKS